MRLKRTNEAKKKRKNNRFFMLSFNACRLGFNNHLIKYFTYTDAK